MERYLSRWLEIADLHKLEVYEAHDGYRGVRKALFDMTPEGIINEMKSSNLRGRGGAAFATGVKWSFIPKDSKKPVYVCCNADESETGSFANRYELEFDPHGIIEGILITCRAVNAQTAYIYFRGEFTAQKRRVDQALAEARAKGYVGKNIMGSGFDVEVWTHRGAGAYVCGEETALLESLEGKRGYPRNRPPFPAIQGAFGGPTVVNNVETMANIPWIVRNGCDAFRELGSSTSRGTKVVSLNSLFCRPGLYEIEFGLPVRAIVEDIGGGLKTGKIAGVIIGGPLAGVVHPDLFDTPFGFEELCAIGASVGHGGIVAFDEHTSVPELVHHIFEFGSFESCGKCTPCRLGSSRIAHHFANILGRVPGSSLDRTELQDIVSALRDASACGLGTGLGEFAQSVLRYYAKDLEPCFM